MAKQCRINNLRENYILNGPDAFRESRPMITFSERLSAESGSNFETPASPNPLSFLIWMDWSEN